MLRISALAVLVALGLSLQAAHAGGFSFDLPRVSFSTATPSGPTTPDLPTRAISR